MKNVFKLLGIIAFVAVIGFSMAACGGDDDGGDDGGDLSWYVFNDSIDGGTSTITKTQGSGNDSNKWTFSGDVRKIPGETWGYAGWGTAPNSARLTAFRNADSFSFKCKGDGKKYWVKVLTSDITDHDDYYKVFTVPTAESTITVNYSDLAQQGHGVQKPFNKNHITNIEFTAEASDNRTGEGPFTVTMWDLQANGGSSSGGGVSGTATFIISGLTPNTAYKVIPHFYDEYGNSSSFTSKQGRSNAAGSVTVSFSSGDLNDKLGWVSGVAKSYWGQSAYVTYETADEWTGEYRSKNTYVMTSATYTLTAPGDFFRE
jgi:hypothetical protein